MRPISITDPNPVQLHQVLVSHELGGAGLLALRLSRRLTDLGKACRVWLPGPGPALNETSRLGLSHGTFDAEGALSPSKFRAGLANWKLSRSLRKLSPGLVHVHSPGYYGALRWGIKWTGLPCVAHVQIEEEPEILRWAFRSPPDLVITCANFLVDYLRRVLPGSIVERTWIESVPNAVDVERFTPGPKRPAKGKVGAPPDKPLVVMLANLSPHKGQETAIRSAAVLKARNIDVQFWLAGLERGGAEDYTRKLRALVEEHGVLDRVQLLGHRSDAPDLLRAADFFVLPSTREGLPLSVLEAQACQVPVLAAPTAGVPEVVRHNETGFLIPADDPRGYADYIQKLLGDHSLTRQVTETAYRYVVREYNWTTFCKRVVALYDELLLRPTPARTGLVTRQAAASSAREASAHSWEQGP